MRYPEDTVDDDYDDGTMPANVDELRRTVVGRKIVAATPDQIYRDGYGLYNSGLKLTLDDGREVYLGDTSDCCAFTNLEDFFLDPSSVDHVITGVGTTDGYTVWHIYADWGDILRLTVGWSCGNPFYYGYGFDITVVDNNHNPHRDVFTADISISGYCDRCGDGLHPGQSLSMIAGDIIHTACVDDYLGAGDD